MNDMALSETLFGLPVQDWRAKQVVALDWCDGPREGFCALSAPECEFYFHVVAERSSADDLDDRIFRLWTTPPDSLAVILKGLRDLGPPASPIWAPVWQFADEESRTHADNLIGALEAQRQATNIVLWTRNFREFLGCWNVADASDGDWFSRLSI